MTPVPHKQSTLYSTADIGWMFIWKTVPVRIGIIHIGSHGGVTGHKSLPIEQARSLYTSLIAKGAKVGTPSTAYDYSETIDWLLRRI